MQIRSGNSHGGARFLTASLYVALIVGTVLNLINQGDALLGMASIIWLKIILTYCVPYVVCTYGAVSYRLKKADVTLERSA